MVLHCGTNDLKYDSSENICKNIIELAKKIKAGANDCYKVACRMLQSCIWYKKYEKRYEKISRLLT